ncbi:LacI family DNA-binding transcriptional regulator [Mycoplasma corogypsi]|uniref:LacI family DNA-binding transcriptional regulator n=1 Tax=Mycoplasma corogypsi TaxID=2106 RepID=UPI003873338F
MSLLNSLNYDLEQLDEVSAADLDPMLEGEDQNNVDQDHKDMNDDYAGGSYNAMHKYKQKQLTYKDIARAAGVSISTISRFYRNGYVSRKTKKIINEIVKDSGYIPNHGARSIKGKNDFIYVILPVWAHTTYSQIVSGIIGQASTQGRKIIQTYTEEDYESYCETIRYILSWKPSAIVVFIQEYNKELFDFLKSITETKVIVYGHQVTGLNCIQIDEVNAFYNLTRRFYDVLNLNNNKMLFLEDRKLSEDTINARYSGFEKACRELNIETERYVFSKRKAEKEKEIFEFYKYTKGNGITNVVCSSHEAFISLSILGYTTLRVTDMGYTSVYDIIRNYKAKIFIDYAYIGYEIYKMITIDSIDNKPQFKVIDPKIIS